MDRRAVRKLVTGSYLGAGHKAGAARYDESHSANAAP